MVRKLTNTSSRSIRIVIFVFFILLFVNYYIRNPEVIESLKTLDKKTIWIGFIFSSISVISLSAFLKFVTDNLAKTIPFSEALYATILSMLANYVLPFRGGLGVRAVYLRKKYDLSYSNYIASLYGNYALIILVNSAVALVSLAISVVYGGTVPILLTLILAALCVFSISLISGKVRIDDVIISWLKKSKLRWLNFIGHKSDMVVTGWKTVVNRPILLRRMVGVILLNFMSRALLFVLLFNAFDLYPGLYSIMLFTAITNLSLFISVTPGALGVRETLLLIFSSSISVSSQDILAISIAERAVTITTLLVTMPIVYVANKYLLRRE